MGILIMRLDKIVLREELSTGEVLLVYRVGCRYNCVIVSGVVGDSPYYIRSDVSKKEALEAATIEIMNDVLDGV